MAAPTNLRQVRFNGEGWTLRSPTDAKKPIHLCPYCALRPRCVAHRRVETIMSEFGVTTAIDQCANFRPTLVFRPPLLGLDGTFNTFRLGKAWHDRVAVGGIVALVDPNDEPIGLAEVTSKTVGIYERLAPEHAPFNHMMLGRPPETAPAELFKVLTRSYGTTFMTASRIVSVIYLRRCHEGGADLPRQADPGNHRDPA
jgi:hypothetical protein